MGSGAGALKATGSARGSDGKGSEVGSVISSNQGGFFAKVRGVFGQADPHGDARSEAAESTADEAQDESEDASKLKQQLASTKNKLKATQRQLAESETRVRDLGLKLQEMFAALKLLKSENTTLTSDLQAAEAHIQQFANPEREAYINKYALEKMTEEYAKFKEEASARELKLTQDLKRVQENLASRSAADEAAKAALRAEVRELRSQKGIARPAAGPQDAAHYDPSKAAAAADGGGGGGAGRAVMHPSSGLKPKTKQSEAAAAVAVNPDGDAIDAQAEAALKKREASLQASMGYLIEQGVLPGDPGYDPLAPPRGGDARPADAVVDYVYDPDEALKLFPAYAAAVVAAVREAQGAAGGGGGGGAGAGGLALPAPGGGGGGDGGGEDGDGEDGEAVPAGLERAIPTASDELSVHRRCVDAFGTQLADAYGTPPFLVRQETVDFLAEYAMTHPRGLVAVLAAGGMGKSHVMAAVAATLAQELPAAAVVPLFVGASAASTDTRRLLATLCRAIAERLPSGPQPSMRAGTAMEDAAFARAERLVQLPAEEKVSARPRRAVPHGLDQLKATLPALLAEAAAAGQRVVVVLDGVSELHDLYAPSVLEWLPELLAPAALVYVSLRARAELDLIRVRVAVGAAVELEPLGGAQRKELLTYLVTKYNTAVDTELARQKAEMRARAEAELARLREERLQRRLQRERLRGPSRRKRKARPGKDAGDGGGAAGGGGGGGGGGAVAAGPGGGAGDEPAGAAGEAAEAAGGGGGEEVDLGLLGEYETEVMLDKKDSGVTLYMIMAVEFLMSLERRLPALEEAQALPETLPGLVDMVLDLLEVRHGKELVRETCMLLESARFALSEAELLQLLLTSASAAAAAAAAVAAGGVGGGGGGGGVGGEIWGLDGRVDTNSELLSGLETPKEWRRFMQDLAPILRPRGAGDMRGHDLRLRHQCVREQVVSRYCAHKCFWHRESSRAETHVKLARFYSHILSLPPPPVDYCDDPTPFQRWSMTESLWQYTHAAEDVVYHLLEAGDWPGAEARLTDLRFIEAKSRAVDPYHLLTDFSAALDTPWRFQLSDPDARGFSFLQRVRVVDFHNFVSTYAAVFRVHPEIVIQQAMNMPDASTVAKEAARLVGDAQVEVAWFKYLNKSQLGDPCILSLKCNGPVDCVAYSPDGRKIATGSGDGFGGKLTIWDARSGTEQTRFALPGAIKSLSFPGDGKTLLCVSSEGTAMLSDMHTLKERARQVVSDTKVAAGALSIDGRKMAIVARDGVIAVWDIVQRVGVTGHVTSDLSVLFELLDEDHEGRPSPMTCVAISPNNRRLFTGTSHGMLKVFSMSMTEGLSVLHVLEGHKSLVPACAFNPDGSRVATCSLDHTVRIWDVERGGKEVATFSDGVEARGCAFSPDGTFVAAGIETGRVELYDLTTGQNVFSFGTHAGRVNAVQFAPNGKFVISGSTDGLCKVWAIQETASSETFTGHEGTDITAVSYSADGGELATAGGDGSVKLWGGRRGAELMAFPGHAERVTSCAFSPLVGDGMGGVITTSLYDGTMRRWDNLTGTEVSEFRRASDYVCATAISADGSKVLSGSFDGSAIVWDMRTGALLVKLGVEVEGTGGWRVEKIRDRHEDAVVWCTFSPFKGSDRAATASVDGTVRVWNTQWGTCVATLRGHAGPVAGCCYSNDGRSLLSASADTTIREWSAEAPFKCVGVLTGHYGAVHAVAFATSGRHLFSVSEDRTLRAWLKARLDGPPAAGTPASRVGSRPFSSSAPNGVVEWFQWQQVAIFASAFPIRCLAGSRTEEEEEVACGGANGSVFLLRLMLPGDV